ncbi:MAG: ketopantoate reductase family protein [Ilumatobacteraceae bacterium]
MDVYVLGAGSLGSVIGAVLARAGHQVTLVTRNDAHVRAIRARGLRLVGESDETVALVAATSVAGLTTPDLMLVLVKSFDTDAAIRSARDAIADDTIVLTLQNGVGCEEIIGDLIGRERVVAGRTFIGGRMIEPGVVEYGLAGRRTTIGELDGRRSDRIVQLAGNFDDAGIAVDVSQDIVATMWDKLFVNVATGAWSALTGLPYGELSVHPDVEAAAIATVAEAMTVAHALGIDVSTTDPAIPWRRAWEGLPHGFKASMLQSIERGARTEVDVMHGAVCDGGRRAGVPTPINDTLFAAVRGLERNLELR